MSWSFEFTARDTNEAKAKVTEQQAAHGPHFPGPASNAVISAIEALPQNPDSDVYVKSYGHIDQPEYGKHGNALIEVKTVPRAA